MKIIDVDAILEQSRKNREKKPEIEVKSIEVVEVIDYMPVPTQPFRGPSMKTLQGFSRTSAETLGWLSQNTKTEGNQLKGDIIAELELQMRNIRVARARVSNKYPEMIRRGASAAELATNHAEIESYSDEMKDIYSRIRYVERYGSLPDREPAGQDPAESDNIIEVKKMLRALVDKRCKLQKKLEPSAKTPKNPDRFTTWSLELDQVQAEYDQVKARYNDLKIKLKSDG